MAVFLYMRIIAFYFRFKLHRLLSFLFIKRICSPSGDNDMLIISIPPGMSSVKLYTCILPLSFSILYIWSLKLPSPRYQLSGKLPCITSTAQYMSSSVAAHFSGTSKLVKVSEEFVVVS